MYNFEYNQDQERRNDLLNIKHDWSYENRNKGGDDFLRYDNLDVATLKILLDEKFADPDEQQNDAPPIKKFYEFMVKHPEFKAHGYATGLRRSDYRVSIEGVEGEPADYNSLIDFMSLFRRADEFEANSLYCRCWYD